jgi:hypothetical protein
VRRTTGIVNAHRINQGVIPDLRRPEAESDFYFVEADDPETAVARIIELVKTRIPRRFGLDPIRDVQALCPMNRGGVGVRVRKEIGGNDEVFLRVKCFAGAYQPNKVPEDRPPRSAKRSARRSAFNQRSI